MPASSAGSPELRAPWGEVFDLMWGAYSAGTIPVGAVLSDEKGTVVARGRNRILVAPGEGQLGQSRLAHAEVNALLQLPSGATYEKVTLYSALEPCHVCLAAAIAVRLGRVRYAAADPYGGAGGVATFYRSTRPDLVALARRLPQPDAGATLADAFAAVS